MVVNPDPFLDECFIKKPNKKQQIKEENIKEELPNDLDNIIKQSLEDLKVKDTINNVEPEPIDLEVVFDKPLEKQTNKNNNKNNIELEEANIVLDVEDLDVEELITEDPSILKEVDLSSSLDNTLETLQLKKPNQVYYEIYQKARENAKDAKKNAILAYLEMKNIKKTYMLNDIDESDSEFEEFASSSEISETESLEDN